jgi:transposase InsO family protein
MIDAGVSPSTGSVGQSYDNAMAEALFSTIKRELIYRQRWETRHDAELAIFSYIEGFYNPERIQDALGMLSPDEFEVLHAHRSASRRFARQSGCDRR